MPEFRPPPNETPEDVRRHERSTLLIDVAVALGSWLTRDAYANFGRVVMQAERRGMRPKEFVLHMVEDVLSTYESMSDLDIEEDQA